MTLGEVKTRVLASALVPLPQPCHVMRPHHGLGAAGLPGPCFHSRGRSAGNALSALCHSGQYSAMPCEQGRRLEEISLS